MCIDHWVTQMRCQFSTALFDKCISLAAGWYQCNWLPCSHPTAVNNACGADKTRGGRKTSPSSSAHFPFPAPHYCNSTPCRWWWLLQRAVMQDCSNFPFLCWPACLCVPLSLQAVAARSIHLCQPGTSLGLPIPVTAKWSSDSILTSPAPTSRREPSERY